MRSVVGSVWVRDKDSSRIPGLRAIHMQMTRVQSEDLEGDVHHPWLCMPKCHVDCQITW